MKILFKAAQILSISLLVSFSSVAAAEDQHWNLNDVSYLFSLPAKTDSPNLLAPNESGDRGALLDRAVYDLVPQLLEGDVRNDTLYGSTLRVIGMRFDPCAEKEEESGACLGEVRLIWQPLLEPRAAPNDEWSTDDAAIHTFYRLSSTEFEQFLNQLWVVKQSFLEKYGIDTDRVTLNTHPAMIDFASNEEFLNSMKSVILAHCGEQNMFKMTFMALLIRSRWWRFAEFNKKADSKWGRVIVPRIDHHFTDFINNEEGVGDARPAQLGGSIQPINKSYPEEDDLLPVMSVRHRFGDERDLPVFRKKLNAVARFRNPKLTNPQNLDCASCHMADASELYMFDRFPVLVGQEPSADQYANPEPEFHDLTNPTIAPLSTKITRSFGYFGRQSAINQRAINESAEVAAYLNLQL